MGSLRSARLLTSVCLLAAACVDTKDVFVQRDLYTEPVTAAEGFLGYNDVEGKTPVCRGCHAAKYDEWKDTKHASAWTGLQSGGQVQESCEACHAVDGRGNAVEDPAGWVATHNARYQDVQCESCHGPGLDHVTNPNATQPLASILVGVDLDNGCGECHQGAQYPFTDEWARSRHAITTNPAQRSQPCTQCHETRGVFAAWGVDAPYVERDQQGVIPIVCAVCHDPHDATNEHDLRYPIDAQDVGTNLCMKCHRLRAVPDPSLSVGPHSPEGPLLLGEAGWRPPNFMSPSEDFTMPHGSANPGMCATCHMDRIEGTGDGTSRYTGHLFNAIPCADAQGLPTTGDCEPAQRSFQACAGSGCHFSASTARTFYDHNRQVVDSLAAELNALLAQAPASEFRTGDGLITTAEGARFNAQLADKVGSVVHNPYLMEALLSASIKQMELNYGLQAASAGVLDHTPGVRP
jgi:predicted CXXCH cytochrome family protein